MNRKRVRSALLAVLVAFASGLVIAPPVAAECSRLDPWPSFQEAATTARRIVIGEVIAGYGSDGAGNLVTFGFRVDEVLRGRSEPVIEFREAVQSGAPVPFCPVDSILRVRIGDVIAIAFDARVSGSPNLVLTIAYIRGVPDDFLMPEVERFTAAGVRAIAAMPSTDAATAAAAPTRHGSVIPIVAGLLGALLSLVRTRTMPLNGSTRRRTSDGPR